MKTRSTPRKGSLVLEAVVAILAAQGYDTSPLQKVPQRWPEKSTP